MRYLAAANAQKFAIEVPLTNPATVSLGKENISTNHFCATVSNFEDMGELTYIAAVWSQNAAKFLAAKPTGTTPP